MKIFFYKSILIFFLFILAIHYSFGLIKKQMKNEYSNLSSKENVEKIKNKIREEIKNSLNKEVLINSDDAELIKSFYNKVKKDLEK